MDYDPATGQFCWRNTFAAGMCCARLHSRPKPGDVVRGTRNQALGYLYIALLGKVYLAHRLVWLHVHGKFPARGLHIDHKNHDGFDNRLCNLRVATRSQNFANSRLRSDNTSGYRGVNWHSQGKKWRASVWFNGKEVKSKNYDDIRDAVKWRDAVAKELHGEFASLNLPQETVK